jgi:hypothetical protein
MRSLLSTRAGVVEEELQDRPFPLGQVQGLVVEPGPVGFFIQGQGAVFAAQIALAAAAPYQGVDAGQQLDRGEGLGEVVVGAQVEAAHALVEGVAGGEHEHVDGVVAARRRVSSSSPSMPGRPMSSTIRSNFSAASAASASSALPT